ncbi:MAG: hypothetical protein Q9218_005147 [Villophora microphyllina]
MLRSSDRDTPRQKGGLIRSGIRALSGGIGLASEGIQSYKQGKTKGKESEPAEVTNHSQNGPHPGNPDAVRQGDNEVDAEEVIHDHEDLEEVWKLDDTQEEVANTPSPSVQAALAKDPVAEFIHNHSTRHHAPETEQERLALPVILPQRRPKERSRGFVRAYAPVLENSGIDQSTWLAFLDAFQRSSAANPWLECINFAAFATLALPLPISFAVEMAIHEATRVTMELQGRQRTNRSLHKLNDEFFRPRGLYCLVMTYDPDSRARIQEVNLTSLIAQQSNPATGLGKVADTFKSSDGTTHREWEFPEAAPLVFPGLDQLGEQTKGDGAQKKKKVAETYKFVANYWDKRATAAYVGLASALARGPKGEFSSRYADPNHAASSGSLIAFATGGRLVPGPESRGLIGGMYSVIDQAVRGVPQGTGKGKQYFDETYGEHHRRNPYSKYYRGKRQKGMSMDSGVKIGPVSTPIGLYKKYLTQVGILEALKK